MHLSSAVMFVSDLDRSIDFYRKLLRAEVTVRTTSAALLTIDDSQLYLRGLGERANHALNSIGIQYLIWSADDVAELERCEGVLRAESPHVRRDAEEDYTLIEGYGPDHVPILVAYPGPGSVPRTRILSRIYGL
jgi:catechol 2,3-dioxygenase-like lactoylglutathione lyase family enzyme